jgi:quinol monooxygenase YgiN
MSEDKEAIRELFSEYCFRMDEGRYAELGEWFTADGEWIAPYARARGPAEIAARAGDRRAPGRHPQPRAGCVAIAPVKECIGRMRMVDRRQVLVSAAGVAGMLTAGAAAQTTPTPPPPEAPFAVTYIEVERGKADAGRRLLMRYRDSLKDAVEFAVFEQNGRPGHFVIIEQWPSAKAREDNAASAAGRDFRAALTPLLVAPADERPHAALSTGPKPTAVGGVYVVTHVDVVPSKREEGTAEVRKLVEASRGSPNNVRFDALVQAGRPNHLTLIEAWTNGGTQETHSAAAPTRAFRTALGPMNGSLYDERLYSLLR